MDSEAGGNEALSSEPILEIQITDPVKQGDGVQAYVSYRVSLKTNMPQYRYSTSFVIRRFSDFLWLHDRLAEQNKGIIIPPLPEKNVVEKFRFSADFIEARRRALNSFLNRVAAHPQLRFSTDLQLFLEASEDVWTIQTARTGDTSLFLGTTGNFMQMFKDVQSSLSQVVLGKERVEEEVDTENETIKGFLQTLEGHLVEVQRHSLRLVKRQRELGQALAEFGEAILQLGNGEGGTLGKAMAELGKKADRLGTRAIAQSSEMLLNFEEPLKEYVRMVQSVKAVVANRSAALKNHHDLLADLETKRSKLGKMKQPQSGARPDKIQELERDINDTTRKAELAKEQYDAIVDRMRVEIVRFQEEKTLDLGSVFLEFARSEAELSNETAHLWHALLPTINSAKPPQVGGL